MHIVNFTPHKMIRLIIVNSGNQKRRCPITTMNDDSINHKTNIFFCYFILIVFSDLLTDKNKKKEKQPENTRMYFLIAFFFLAIDLRRYR